MTEDQKLRQALSRISEALDSASAELDRLALLAVDNAHKAQAGAVRVFDNSPRCSPMRWAVSLLNVSFDASKLESWASELSNRGFKNAIRRAVDQSARAARKSAIPIIAADIGVSPSRIKAAVPRVVATKAGDLSARWTISKLKIGILNVAGASVARVGGLNASTHRLTGGKSASLHVAKAFVINANGGRFVAFRRTGSRLPIKSVYAESPSTAMAQDGATARVAWQKEASRELSARLTVEIQKQLVSEGLSAATPDNSD